MKKDDIKKIIGRARSAFDGFSIVLLLWLVLLGAYIGILRLISPFSETTKGVVVIGIPLAVLIFMFKGFRKGGNARQYVIDSLIIFVVFVVLDRAIRYLAKIF
jgi:hypothetical protein